VRASFVRETGQVLVGDFDRPQARAPGHVVVETHLASVCGSDVHSVFDGFLKSDGIGKPGYPGHEGVGVITESTADAFSSGERVLTVPALGGCFAEAQLLDDVHVVRLPPDGDLRRLLMAQQYGTTLYAMRTFWAGPAGRAAVVIGTGSAGLFFVQQLRQLGFPLVIATDLRAERLRLARRLGADVVVNALEEPLMDAVMDLTGGLGADLVVEAAGYDSTRALAVDAVRVRGTVGCFGYPERSGDAPFPAYKAFRKALRIQWVSGTQSEPGLRAFHDAVAQIHAGQVDVEHCLGTTYPLEQIQAALLAARDGTEGVKITIDVGGRTALQPS
jgi:L-iditol 2-dehydrogenase